MSYANERLDIFEHRVSDDLIGEGLDFKADVGGEAHIDGELREGVFDGLFLRGQVDSTLQKLGSGGCDIAESCETEGESFICGIKRHLGVQQICLIGTQGGDLVNVVIIIVHDGLQNGLDFLVVIEICVVKSLARSGCGGCSLSEIEEDVAQGDIGTSLRGIERLGGKRISCDYIATSGGAAGACGSAAGACGRAAGGWETPFLPYIRVVYADLGVKRAHRLAVLGGGSASRGPRLFGRRVIPQRDVEKLC